VKRRNIMPHDHFKLKAKPSKETRTMTSETNAMKIIKPSAEPSNDGPSNISPAQYG
jgi:hypothetical protein